MNPVELLGFLGGGIGVFQALPQILRLRRLGHGRGVSVATWLLFLVVSSSWFGYGFRTGSPSMVVTNLVAAVLNGMVVAALLQGNARAYVSPWLALPVIGGVFAVSVNLAPAAVTSAWLVLLTASGLPQVRKSWQHLRRGEGSAVSLHALAVSSISLISWGLWAILMQQPLVILTTSIALAINITIATLESLPRGTSKAPADIDLAMSTEA